MRISYGGYASVFSVVYLGMATNLLLALTCLPLLALAIGTNPAQSWPLLAGASVLAAPGLCAAFAAFRGHDEGGAGPVRAFLAGYRTTWRKALLIGLAAVAVTTLALVDVRVLAGSSAGVLVVPVLLVVAVSGIGIGLVALVALAEVPSARLRDVVRAAGYLALRRWYLTAVSLLVVGLQIALFANLPAIAIGITAAAAAYLAWSNSRYTLRPVLDTPQPQTA